MDDRVRKLVEEEGMTPIQAIMFLDAQKRIYEEAIYQEIRRQESRKVFRRAMKKAKLL